MQSKKLKIDCLMEYIKSNQSGATRIEKEYKGLTIRQRLKENSYSFED